MSAAKRVKLRALPLLAALPLVTGCLGFHRGAMPGEPSGATFEVVEGTRVRYVDVGEGPPVVLLHGFASSLEAWDAVRPALAGEHQVIALDLKGFGWTDRPEGDYSPQAQAKLVLALLDRRGVREAAFVGHSWGASVALAVALLAPERVTRLALYDAWVYEEQLPTFFHWARAGGVGEALFAAFYAERPEERLQLAFYDPRAVTEKLVEDVERALERPGTTAAALAAVRGQDFAKVQARYREIRVPVLLLWGREDAVTVLPFGERMARELPQARLVVYPRCGHFPMIEAAAASNEELRRFLAEPGEPATGSRLQAPASPESETTPPASLNPEARSPKPASPTPTPTPPSTPPAREAQAARYPTSTPTSGERR